MQQAISALVKNKTLIVIAHRLSTIRDADQILVVDNGKIVEKGVHAELIQQKGIYQKFWNIRQKARNWKLAQYYALRRAICRLPQLLRHNG